EPRFETDQEITLTLLGDVESTFTAKIVNFSGKGLCLLSSQAVAPGASLKIELADRMVLGEAMYCRQEGQAYHTGIGLEQALYHTWPRWPSVCSATACVRAPTIRR